MSRKGYLLAALLFFGVLSTGCATGLYPSKSPSSSSPVSDSHITKINQSFRKNNINKGHVEIDRYGRIELKGEYRDEKQVDRAFSLAQTIVGPKWVSPVTPEKIDEMLWEKELSELFLKRRPISPPAGVEAAPGPVRNKYALVVGVGKFKNKKITQLYAARDATAFHKFLIDPQGGNFPSENVTLLLDERATKNNIEKALKDIERIAGADDLVCVYFSSHGTPPDKYGGVFIVTYDSVVIPRDKIWYTSVTEKMLSEFVQKVRAKRLLIIVDACYSNGAYKHIPGFLPTGGKSLGIDDEEGEGYGLANDFGARILGAKDIIVEEKEADDKIVEEGSSPAGWGKVLISASGAGERAWQSDNLAQSYFTFYFLKGLQDKNGALADAFYYSKPLVIQVVRTEKFHQQTPQVITTRQDWNMPVGVR